MTQNMETDPFNVSMRKFLKQVGVTSQQAIEKAVAEKGLKGKGRLTVKAVITSEAAGLNQVVEGEIAEEGGGCRKFPEPAPREFCEHEP